MSVMPLLQIRSLSVAYATVRGPHDVLRDIDLAIARGETLALVGESGSGKSTVASAIMGLLGPGSTVESGEIWFDGRDLLKLQKPEWCELRGRRIALVFQDPFTSLNPALRIGEQIADSLLDVPGISREQIHGRVLETLSEVGLPSPGAIASAYPHQLSGGMRQRALIAAALISNPELLLLDEPTTALDVTVEAQILDLLEKLREERRLTILFITHNIGVVTRIAHRISVLYAGRVLEAGPKRAVLARPAHPYTKGLLASMPKLSPERTPSRVPAIPGRPPDAAGPGCVFESRCPLSEGRCRTPQPMRALGEDHEARCWKINQATAAEIFGVPPVPHSISATDINTTLVRAVDLKKVYRGERTGTKWRRIGGVVPWPQFEYHETAALDGISLEIQRGQVIGVVGESGSGKSTLGRAILRLLDVDSGLISFDGVEISAASEGELRRFRKRAQIVFQNPHSSLNPRMKVGAAIQRRVRLHSTDSARVCRQKALELLEFVGLAPDFYHRYPHQLSGGEKQRVGIARALASNPDLLVCDEPVSALDVSIQATILNLLADLRTRFALSYLFISHDIAVVSYLSDRVIVMYSGRICEEGPTRSILAPPYHPYTEALLSAVPGIELERAKAQRRDSLALTSWNNKGCPFHLRCPKKLGRICEEVRPSLASDGKGHSIACHIPAAELANMQTELLRVGGSITEKAAVEGISLSRPPTVRRSAVAKKE